MAAPAESVSRFSAESLSAKFARIRMRSLDLAEPLAPEDTVVQSMPDVSPTKWHLAHVTWFFERMVLEAPEYQQHVSASEAWTIVDKVCGGSVGRALDRNSECPGSIPASGSFNSIVD